MQPDTRVWGYRRAENGEVEGQIFDAEIPEGWADSPANVGEPAPEAPVKRPRGRPRKVTQ